MIKIQEEKQVSVEEWNTIWLMFEAKQRRLEIEEIEEEIVEIKNNELEKQNFKGLIELLDLGAPVNRARNEWMKRYLKDHGSELKDLKNSKCHQRFRVWKNQIRRVRRTNVKEELKHKWKSKIDTENNVLETNRKRNLMWSQIIVKGRENPLAGVIKIGMYLLKLGNTHLRNVPVDLGDTHLRNVPVEPGESPPVERDNYRYNR